MPELLGVDNVMFAVRDLDDAVRFYEACGFTVKFRIDRAGMALFAIGSEAPGLLIRAEGGGGPGSTGAAGAGRFWIEVSDADAVAAELSAAGIATERLETATGITVEATDPSGNVVGFADYSKRPEMARR
jgi:catechol 2,3-dioxygenase-like lactoylglutathione lyase family enzyme